MGAGSARWEKMRSIEILAVMHEHSPDHACGENELQIPDFASYQWEWMANVPGFRDLYLSHDQTTHYLYMRNVLRLWPSVSERAEMDAQVEPAQRAAGAAAGSLRDATVVMIHRDPAATLRSLLTMRGMAVKSSQIDPDIDAHVDYWVARIERMLHSYMSDRPPCARGPAGRSDVQRYRGRRRDGSESRCSNCAGFAGYRGVPPGPSGVHDAERASTGTAESSTTSRATSG